MCQLTSIWGKHVIQMTGSRVSVTGIEHLTDHNNVCFISNHQGNFDIPLVIGHIPKIIGFIAKKELLWMPIINLWMNALNCVFIDRKNPRKALAGVEKGIQNIGEKGQALALFPEGTRSRSSGMNSFKTGNLRMVIRSGVTIIPLTIDGTYQIWESAHKIKPARISLSIHQPIETLNLSDLEKRNLPSLIEETIRSSIAV